MKCPKCGNEHCVKAGFNHNKQRYKCKNCKHQYTQTTDKNTTKRAFALYLYVIGLSMNAIGRMLKVEPSTILYWVRNFALKIYKKPAPQSEVIIELDEMWHFLRSKKTRFGYGRRIVELPESLLIGNGARCRLTLELPDNQAEAPNKASRTTPYPKSKDERKNSMVVKQRIHKIANMYCSASPAQYGQDQTV